MGFTLDKVVPWGRCYQEYVKMFSLSDTDLKRHILGCGDGPASFNASLTEQGGNIIDFTGDWSSYSNGVRIFPLVVA